jgi:hypothetical protein
MMNYPTGVQAPTPTPPAQPSALPASRLFAPVLAIIFVVVTAGAVALATYAPQTLPANADAAPSGWTQVYNTSLASDDGQWSKPDGCQFANGGLDIQNGAVCEFQPSKALDLTSQGFLIKATVAPDADIGGNEDLTPRILLDDGSTTVDAGLVNPGGAANLGDYEICIAPTGSSTCATQVQGGTIYWHGDDFVANTLAVKYDSSANQVTLYINDQQVATANVTLGQSTIALGSPSNREALFTHATLYSSSAGSLNG